AAGPVETAQPRAGQTDGSTACDDHVEPEDVRERDAPERPHRHAEAAQARQRRGDHLAHCSPVFAATREQTKSGGRGRRSYRERNVFTCLTMLRRRAGRPCLPLPTPPRPPKGETERCEAGSSRR